MPPPAGSARIRRCSSTESFVLPSSSTSSSLPAASSHRSVRSTGSAAASGKSPYWQAWSNINKLGTLMVRGGRPTNDTNNNSSSSIKMKDGIDDDNNNNHVSSSKLTAERLAAHNRRVAVHQHYSTSTSPYYKGLTDSSLVISRERGHHHDILVDHHDVDEDEDEDDDDDDLEIVPSFVSKMKEWRRRLSFSSKLESITVVDTTSNITNNIEGLVVVDDDGEDDNYEINSNDDDFVAAAAADKLVGKPLKERIITHDDDTDIDHEQHLLVQSSLSLSSSLVEKEFEWANKYRPKALKDFICNRDKALHLQSIIKEVNCNHFILQGPAGVGKTTMIWAVLQEAFGPDNVESKEEGMTFKLQGESIGSIRVRVKASRRHVEVNVSDMKGYEKHIMVELIKNSHQRASSQSSHSSPHSKHDACRAIVLHEAEKLSADGVVYIKWLLERYKGFSKFFFCCGDDASKLQPITTLCTLIQLSPPSHLEIVEVLELIAKQEGIELPHEFAARIAANSKNNLRQAIRSLEACRRKSYPFSEDQVIWTGWEDHIANIAKNIIEEQSPKQLYLIRGKLQNLIEHDVSPEFIFMTLRDELKSRLMDEACQNQVENLYKDYSRNRSRGGGVALSWGHYFDEKEPPAKLSFMRIEEFIAKFMSSYKTAMANGRTTVVKDTNGATSSFSDS